MNDNINMLVLKSFFKDGEVWLEDLHLLKFEYSVIARKLLALSLDSNKVPSENLFLANIEKIDFKEIPANEKIQFKTKVKTIMKVILELDLGSYTREELLELLKEEYLSDGIQEILPQMVESVSNRDFNKVKGQILQIESYLDKTNTDYNFEDNEDLFLGTSNKLNFVSTGFDESFLFSKMPEGALGLLIARSKQGKSALMISSVVNTFLSGQNVLLISYELPRVSLINRMISYISQVGIGEINTDIYSVSDNAERVRLARYTLAKNVTFNQAKRIYLEKGWEGLDALPPRENRMIIKASITKDEMEKMKEKNIKPKALPNDLEILQEIKNLNKVMRLGWVYIDYLSLIPFFDTKGTRETNIANFSRNLKQVLLETSTCALVLAQGRSREDFYVPLYSVAPTLDSDFCISIQGSRTQLEEGKASIHITLSRHTESFISYECNRDLSTQTFQPTGQTMDFEDFLEYLKKEEKGNSKKS